MNSHGVVSTNFMRTPSGASLQLGRAASDDQANRSLLSSQNQLLKKGKDGDVISETRPGTEKLNLKKKENEFKKSPDAPRRFKSAFILFSAEKHKEIRANMGDRAQSERTASLSKIVSEAWRLLPPDEKHKWEMLARSDRNRYEIEKSLYKGPWHIRKSRKRKDANAPRRPMSAFLAFANSRRAEVKRTMPGASNGDVSRALSAMWKGTTVEVRQHYVNQELEKRQQYIAAITDWRKKNEAEKRAERKEREETALRLAEAMELSIGKDNDFFGDYSTLDQEAKGLLPTLNEDKSAFVWETSHMQQPLSHFMFQVPESRSLQEFETLKQSLGNDLSIGRDSAGRMHHQTYGCPTPTAYPWVGSGVDSVSLFIAREGHGSAYMDPSLNQGLDMLNGPMPSYFHSGNNVHAGRVQAPKNIFGYDYDRPNNHFVNPFATDERVEKAWFQSTK